MFGKSISTLIDSPMAFYIRTNPLLATDIDQPGWVCYYFILLCYIIMLLCSYEMLLCDEEEK
jgi:hypothetical protein